MDREDQEKQKVVDYLTAFASESGKRVLDDLKRVSGSGISVIPCGHNGHIDVYEVMRNEGKRFMVIYIETLLAKDPNRKRQKEARREL